MTEEQIHSNNGSYSAKTSRYWKVWKRWKASAMYISDDSSEGLHHLVYEGCGNSIDEALAGYCDHIKSPLTRTTPSPYRRQPGRGIRWTITKGKKSALEVVMTVLHAGGKVRQRFLRYQGGLHGVGVSCVNALSYTHD